MFSASMPVYLLSFLSFALVLGLLGSIYQLLNRRRLIILERLQGAYVNQLVEDEDILQRPFLERTVGALARWLVSAVGQTTPAKVLEKIEAQLERAGNPRNLKAGDLLASQVILGLTALILAWFALPMLGVSALQTILLSFTLAALTVYLPWFVLASMASKRQQEIRRSLPDIMDLLVVSVEAGLAFDMALLKVAERFRGTVAREFMRVLREIQLGKLRKDALKDMADRVDLMELAALVNAVIQADQLGVGIANILRMQADLIREKRQQWIEEQAMKAPIKMLFPLVFFIFPCIFIIILGPAMLSILKALGALK